MKSYIETLEKDNLSLLEQLQLIDTIKHENSNLFTQSYHENNLTKEKGNKTFYNHKSSKLYTEQSE